MRVGVGVGAVLLGGCDLIDEAAAEAEARPEQVEAEAGPEQVEAEARPQIAADTSEVSRAPAAPGASLERRAQEPAATASEPEDAHGVAGLVAEAIERSRQEPASGRPEPIRDLGRPAAEPEGDRAFIPYDGGTGTVAAAPSTLAPRPRRRPRRKVAAPVDEPCDPGSVVASPPGDWDGCPACGRG